MKPDAVLVELVAVVGGERDDGRRRIERREHAGELAIQVPDLAVVAIEVGGAEARRVLGRDIRVVGVVVVQPQEVRRSAGPPEPAQRRRRHRIGVRQPRALHA